ncbi:MAG: DUF305 domain-containing protein [Micavibrio aeruginosavorus]|uniref:DUF305 domain-containing protein n=1 Tax=Micavibrio aeruginosavorus TaxID=349221 RepID=A0A2W5FQ53_9BACT|nr:MAG: DUF305 domain-containing protein [Micavibrio aeruginosavorus]
MKNMTLAFLATMALSAPSLADEHATMDHSKMHHESPASDLYAPSRDAMHKDMNVEPTGNADKDFVLNMIPHHEGAVAMARVQLEHGKDPELRKLAEDIIKAQDKEIEFMKAWLEKNK